jgi:hypothetical protein
MVRVSTNRGDGATICAGADERFVHDLADGAGTTATLGAATEAAIDLPGRARSIFSGADHVSHIVVGQDVAMTNNHRRPLRLDDLS